MWLTLTYLLHTCGELCLSPVGLSSMTKLAPARVAGLMMGVWFLGASVGNFIARPARVVLRIVPAAESLRGRRCFGDHRRAWCMLAASRQDQAGMMGEVN